MSGKEVFLQRPNGEAASDFTLIDWRLKGGLFLCFDSTALEYQVTNTLIPWHPEAVDPYLFKSPNYTPAKEFFKQKLKELRGQP